MVTRDLIAGLVALVLLLVALLLVAALAAYRARREERYRDAAARGRRIVAEIPTEKELVLVAEDAAAFYYGDRAIPKRAIRAVEVRVNDAPLAVAGARATRSPQPPRVLRPENSSHDRWDVVIHADDGPVVIECGAIREQVSQEIALQIYEAVKRVFES